MKINQKMNDIFVFLDKYYPDAKCGLIYSKDELEEYIDKGDNAIKEKYNVDKVYIPNNLKIVKDILGN